MEKKFEKNTFGKRLGSMLSVDFRRMFVSPFFYIMLGIALAVPILILTMTTMFSGPSIDPVTGKEVTMEMFTNVWQAVSSLSTADTMAMDLTTMCNLNMMYFALAVFVTVFIAADFRSGYAKNLFAVRSQKSDYIISKTVSCFVAGALMVLCFFVGALLGGAIAGLSFAAEGVGIDNIIFCILSKLLLVPVFVGIYVLMSVIAKQRTWLSMCLSFGIGMFLFMMIPMLTPLDATFMNVALCLVGGVLFSLGLGAVSRLVLKKGDIL